MSIAFTVRSLILLFTSLFVLVVGGVFTFAVDDLPPSKPVTYALGSGWVPNGTYDNSTQYIIDGNATIYFNVSGKRAYLLSIRLKSIDKPRTFTVYLNNQKVFRSRAYNISQEYEITFHEPTYLYPNEMVLYFNPPCNSCVKVETLSFENIGPSFSEKAYSLKKNFSPLWVGLFYFFLALALLSLLHTVSRFRHKINVTGISVLLVLFIFIIALAPRITTPSAHRMYIDEFLNMGAARSILTEGKPKTCVYSDFEKLSCGVYAKEVGYPAFIAPFFFAFGVNNYIPIYLNILLGSLIPVLVFLFFLYFLPNPATSTSNCASEKRSEHIYLVSFLAALLITFNPAYIMWSKTAVSNILGVFFFLIFLIFFGMYHYRKLSVLPALLFSILTMLARVEFLVYIPSMLLVYYLLYGLPKKYFTAMLFTVLPLITVIAFNLPNSLRFNLSLPVYFIPILLIAMLGLVKLYVINKRLAVLLFLWTLIFIPELFLFQTFSRKYLLIFVFLSIFMAYGLYQLFFLKKMFLYLIFISLIALFATLNTIEEPLLEYSGIIPSPESYLQTQILSNIEKDASGCYIITERPEMLMATTNIKALGTKLVLDDPGLLERLKEHTCVLFYEGIGCTSKKVMEWRTHCDIFKQNFRLRPFKSYEGKGVRFNLYTL